MKWIATSLLGAGLLAGAAAWMFHEDAREKIAAAAAAKAENEADAARSEAQKEKLAAQAELAKAQQQAQAAAMAAETRKTKEADLEKSKVDESAAREARAKAEADAVKAAEDRARAEAEEKKAADDRAAALARKETAKLEAQKAKSDAEAEASRAQAEADALAREKLAADKTIAERDLLELRRLNLEHAERELLEWRRNLEERELALKPEKTILDLSYAESGEDAAKTAEGKILPENNPAIPRRSRRLHKAERMAGEQMDEISSNVESNVTARLERLYEKALREDRIVDADFYRKQIKQMYPGWIFTPGEEGKGKREEEKQ